MAEQTEKPKKDDKKPEEKPVSDPKPTFPPNEKYRDYTPVPVNIT